MQSLGKSSPKMSAAPNTQRVVKHHPSQSLYLPIHVFKTVLQQGFLPYSKVSWKFIPKLPAEMQKSAGAAGRTCLRECSDRTIMPSHVCTKCLCYLHGHGVGDDKPGTMSSGHGGWWGDQEREGGHTGEQKHELKRQFSHLHPYLTS